MWKVTVTSSLLDAKPEFFPVSGPAWEKRYRNSRVLREQDYSGKLSGSFSRSSGREFYGRVIPDWVIQEEVAHLAYDRHSKRFVDPMGEGGVNK